MFLKYKVVLLVELHILSGKGIDGDLTRTSLIDLWWGDKWEHLENPPKWLKIGHFVQIMPQHEPNSIIRDSMRLAQANLDVARMCAFKQLVLF